MSIKVKISLIMGLVFLFGTSYIAVNISQYMSKNESITKSKELNKLSLTLSNLMHELQKERGISTGHLSSKNDTFKQLLNEQRVLSDKKIKAFSSYIDSTDWGIFPESFKHVFTLVQKQLKNIGEKRSSIDSKTINLNQEISYFTDINAQLLHIFSWSSKLEKNEHITIFIDPYINFLKYKELLGLERAVLLNIFAAEKFEKNFYLEWLKITAKKDAYLDAFLNSSSEQNKAIYYKNRDRELLQERNHFRDILTSRIDEGTFDVQPAAWFYTATKNIDSLQDTEKKFYEENNKVLHDIELKSKENIINHTIYALILLALMIIIIFVIGNTIKSNIDYIKSLLDISDEGQIVMNTKFKILDYNQKASKIFHTLKIGDELNELLFNDQDIFIKNEAISFQNFLKKIIIQPNLTHTLRLNKKYYKITYKIFLKKRIISFYDITKEIIETKRNKLIFNLQNSIVVVKSKNSIENINNEFFDTFDYSSIKDFTSKHKCISELFLSKESHEYLKPMVDSMMWNEYIALHNKENHKVLMLDKFNKERIYQVESSGQVDGEEVITFSDITLLIEQKQLLANQAKFTAMGEMIAMIAHQWRQPLTTLGTILGKMNIMNQLDELSEKKYDEGYKKSIKIIKHMSNTIDDFRNFFDKKPNKENISIENLITKSLEILNDSFKQESITQTTIYDGDSKNTIINIDRSKFAQIILNICNNSIDEIKEKNILNPTIEIQVHKEDEFITISIIDNAGGIPQDIIPKLFDPYFSTKSKNGTGLGLYMSKMIVQDHLGGKINVHNTESGANFSLKLPLKSLDF
nr:nitrate- and nitrite sensing domain-containing protein [uncultured Sulfurimonas sp.]